jgi:uncharacterized membrane protein
MRTYYNLIAGQSLERLAALSDGIFAVAMTLLVLDLRVPISTISQPISREQDLLIALERLGPNVLPYVMSFLTLGIFGSDSKHSSTISREAIAISHG